MSNREKCIAIIDQIEESQLANIAAMLQAMKTAMDEAADDAYCMKLYQDYLNDPDAEKGEGIPLEDLARELGVEL